MPQYAVFVTDAPYQPDGSGKVPSSVVGGVGSIIKAGVVNLGVGGTSLVTFGTAFPVGSNVRVTVTAAFANTDVSCTYSAHTVTVAGFTLQGAGNPAGNVQWIATNAGNA